MKKRQPVKWRIAYVPTGDEVGAPNIRTLWVKFGELLSTEIRASSPDAYDRTRQMIFDKWGLSVGLTDITLLHMMEYKKVVLLVKHVPKTSATPYSESHHKLERSGALKVRIARTDTQFVIPSRPYLYPYLVSTLYPTLQPSERTVRFQLFSWATMNINDDTTTEELLQLLIQRKILIIEEINYNVK